MSVRRLLAATAIAASAASLAPATTAVAAPATASAPSVALAAPTASSSIGVSTYTVKFTAEQTRLLAALPSCGTLPSWPIFTKLSVLLPRPLPCSEISLWARKAVAAGKNLGMTVSMTPISPYVKVTYFLWG